jgi:hypothetical protein
VSQCVGRVPRLEATGEPEGLNQIEIWFSILMRKLIKRSSFDSEGDLATKILDFIAYHNEKIAKPFKWTYQGKVLTAYRTHLRSF